MTGSHSKRVPSAAAIAAVAILALTAVRVAVLMSTRLSLGGDEAQYWFWARNLDWGYFSKPPMVAWVIAATTAPFGQAEWAVRLGAPLLHAGTASAMYLLGRDMAGARAGAWAAVVYLTLPAVSFSSGVISTDAPLLFFWSVALLALWRGLRAPGVAWAVLLGAAIGLGMLSKYAMAYFVLCAVAYAGVVPSARGFVFGRRGLIALAVAALVLAPNLAWNLMVGWVTFGHTAENAHLGGTLFHPVKGVEFVLSQAAVFGPVPFVALAWRFATLRRDRPDGPEAFLVFFSAPVLLLILAQAFLSRANANWAAVAYAAAAVLVVVWLLRRGREYWLKATLGLHLAAAAGLYAAVLAPDAIVSMTGRDPFASLRDWRAMAATVRDAMKVAGTDVLTSDHRMTIGALAYQMRDDPVRLRAWDHDGVPENHFELAIRYVGEPGGRIVHVTRAEDPKGVRRFFAEWHEIARFDRPRPSGRTETFHVYVMTGYVGEEARWPK